MGRTKEVAWRNTYAPRKCCRPKTPPTPIQYSDSGSGSNSNKSDDNDEQSLDEGDSDVELLDPQQEKSESVENVSRVLDSSNLNVVKTKELGTGVQDSDSESASDADWIAYNRGKTMGETRERAWTNTETPMKKLKQTQKESRDVFVTEYDKLVDTKQEQCELVENASPMSEFVEKFSSPQSDIICVQGYQVKRSNAPILEAIFKKHGDIAAGCVFETDIVRSSFIEIFCDVVKRIQINDVNGRMVEIERRLKDAEAANINVTWLRAHLEAINKRKESSKKCTMLMGMKENMSLVKKAAQKDLRERCDELMVAQQSFERVECCVRVLHLVEKNLDVQIFESKSELHSLVTHPVV